MTTFADQVFQYGGVPVSSGPQVPFTTGKTYFVSSVTGSNGNSGRKPSEPVATFDYAIGLCTAAKNDVIILMPGHAENVASAAAIAMDVSGIQVVGIGSGALRPTFTMITINSATITVAASNMSISNCIFTSTIAACATVFDNVNAVVANDFTIKGCEFRDSSTTLNIVKCFRSGTTANQADGFSFIGNTVTSIMGTPTAATQCVLSQAAQKRFTLTDNVVVRTALLNNTATLLAMGANAHTLMTIARNRTNTPNTGTTAGELFSGGGTTSTGHVYDNYSWHLASTGLLGPVSTGLAFSQNYCSITGAADKQPVANPLLV